jgi:hypothetical protein
MALDPEAELRQLLFGSPAGPRRLRALLPLLPPESRPLAGFVAASLLLEDPATIGGTLADVARGLDSLERRRVLAEAVRPRRGRQSLADLVPDDLLLDALEATLLLGDAEQIIARVLLSRRLPEPERSTALQGAQQRLTEARQSGPYDEYARLAAALLPVFPELSAGLIEGRRDLDPYDWARVLAAAGGYLQGGSRRVAQSLAFDAARQIESEQVQAELFSTIIAGVQDNRDLLLAIRDIGQRMQHHRPRARVLRRVQLAGVPVPGFELERELDQEQVAQLVARLPAERWTELADQFLNRLLELWSDLPRAAAAPPPTPPPSPPPPAPPLSFSPPRAVPPAAARPPAPERILVPQLATVRERVVSTGFAGVADPVAPLAASEPLAPAQDYYFWFQLGERLQPGAIDVTAAPLPIDKLPVGTQLTIVLYAFEGELETAADGDVGQLTMQGNGTFRVERQPGGLRPILPPNLLTRRLLFGVRTPMTFGLARLRCSIFCRGVLLESRVVHAVIGPVSREQQPALRSTVDYTLSSSLDPAFLAELIPHRLSVLLNDNADGTHGLRLFGTDGTEIFNRDARLTDFQLQDLIEVARAAQRRVAWGDADAWTDGKPYRYGDGRRDLDRLANDLARLAVAGYRLYGKLIERLGGAERATLERLLRESVMVQIAMKESAGAYLPAAMMYDIHFDTGAFLISATQHHLCPTFEAALLGDQPLDACACFHDACPTRAHSEALRADPTRLMQELGPVVCPSGFWGFRHKLGLPLSVGELGDTPLTIGYTTTPVLTAGIWASFAEWPKHELQLRTGGRQLDVGKSRADVLRLLRASRPHVVYFYCHGGFAGDGSPCLFVGGPEDAGITPDNLEANGIQWQTPQPLVFINGCNTTSLEPKAAFDFVSSFVQEVHAAGVIGTEITVFEPLARAFAEAALDRFLSGAPIGEAVRQARLSLLKDGNPLGLVYVPFVIGSLRMVSQAP